MSGYAYADSRPSARVSPYGMTSEPPPATEGCGPGITRCSLEKLANAPCPPPMFPYGGLPGFKQDWLDGYYSVCEGLGAMLRKQLGIGDLDFGNPMCRGFALGGAAALGTYWFEMTLLRRPMYPSVLAGIAVAALAGSVVCNELTR